MTEDSRRPEDRKNCQLPDREPAPRRGLSGGTRLVEKAPRGPALPRGLVEHYCALRLAVGEGLPAARHQGGAWCAAASSPDAAAKQGTPASAWLLISMAPEWVRLLDGCRSMITQVAPRLHPNSSIRQ